jgi:phenylacetate-CoA ligase
MSGAGALAGAAERRLVEKLDRPSLERLQVERFNALLAAILPHNKFYAAKLQNCPRRIERLDQLAEYPFTTKQELAEAGLAAMHTFPLDRYIRYHQTSGTHGRPLPVLDTPADWQWWLDGWQFVLDAAGVTAADRALLAFSFGPFIGFWTAHDALVARGALAIPSGGMNSLARLELLERTEATVLCCTPSYALRLVEVAAEHKISLAGLAVRRIIVAGEPGGSQPAVRRRIEEAWQAELVDHAGASEVGPWGYGDADRRGLYVNESQFIAEFVDCGLPIADCGLEDTVLDSTPSAIRNPQSAMRELVLTSLGRHGLPVIRYRTGDLVRPSWPAAGANRFVLLEGGVVARADDMLIIRGVNVFPSAIDEIVRSFPEVVEYRAVACKRGEMDELVVEVEDRLGQPRRIAEEFNLRLGLHVEVRVAAPLSLPRFEGKARRVLDSRPEGTAE